jgi:hypothetical protein
MKDERRDLDAHFPLDAILPVQFYDRGLVSIQDEGIRRLLGAILEDAVRTFQSGQTIKVNRVSKRTAVREAEAWIFEASVRAPFSYNNVCQFLGIDPDALRRGLSEWQQRCKNGGIAEKLSRRTSVRVETRLKPQRARRN